MKSQSPRRVCVVRGQRSPRGFMLLEALVAILIFSLGILGMVSLGIAAVATRSDAQYRTEAASLADEIAAEIALNVDRSNLESSLSTFAHRAMTSGQCNFAGAPSEQAAVVQWVNKLVPTSGAALLPGMTAAALQILVNTSTGVAGYNRVSVTVCWQAPRDLVARSHTLVTYVN